MRNSFGEFVGDIRNLYGEIRNLWDPAARKKLEKKSLGGDALFLFYIITIHLYPLYHTLPYLSSIHP